MIRFLVHRPIAVLVSFFALLLLGVAAFLKLPVSLLPEVDIPVILVRASGDDMSAQEAEERLTKPLRNSLQQLRGLKELQSTTSEGSGTIRLAFDHGVDIGTAFIEANEKVDMAMNSLPREVARPVIVKSGIADIPAFRLNVYPKNTNATTAEMIELGSFAREIVRRRIEQIPEVAMADLTGFLLPRVEVVPKAGYLESLGLDAETLLRAFRENTTNLGTVLVKDGHYRYYLRFSGELQNLENLSRTPLNINGRLFRLSDLADIDYTTAAETGFYRAGEHTAINFAVIKQASARMADLKGRFGELVERMRRDYPDIAFEVSQDQTLLLDLSIGNLQQDLLLGGFLAFVLMLAFIHKLRLAVLIGVTMPLSLMISQLGFYLFGMSMNIISLGGLILGLSMIIDNSIVVIDTIAEHRAKGAGIREAAIAGTNEIIRPLITSVLTNCAVFIPLIFLSGLAGAIFYDQALSIVIGVVSSLIVAILLLPPLYALIHRESPRKQKRRTFAIKPLLNFTGLYDRGLKWSFRHPYWLTVIVVLLTLAGVRMFPILEKSRLPEITRSDFEVSIDWNEYLDGERIKTRTADIVRAFREETEAINSWSGPQQYLLPIMDDLGLTQNRLYVKLRDPAGLEGTRERLQRYVRSRYPLAVLTFHPAKNAFDEVFSDRNAPLTLIVNDKKHRKMPRIAVVGALLDTIAREMPEARVNPIALYDKVVLDIAPDVAMRYGISANRIGDAIAGLLKERKISDFQSSTTLIPLVLRGERPKSIRNMLDENFVVNADKEQIPLAALVKMGRQTDYRHITASAGGEYYPIDIFSEDPKSDLKKLGEVGRKFESEVETRVTGSYFENEALVGDMAFILAVSVLLLYFILAAQFESLVQPLFILVELPVAICGTVLLLHVGGAGLNIMSMIGIVVMSGLIINDSILKIDAINQLRRRGVPLMEAIFEGGHKRIRPIIMIALTSIGALLPTLFMDDLGSELQKPLVLALIGGMVVGLFVSLFFVPVVYWFIYKKENLEI